MVYRAIAVCRLGPLNLNQYGVNFCDLINIEYCSIHAQQCCCLQYIYTTISELTGSNSPLTISSADCADSWAITGLTAQTYESVIDTQRRRQTDKVYRPLWSAWRIIYGPSNCVTSSCLIPGLVGFTMFTKLHCVVSLKCPFDHLLGRAP